MKRIFVFAVLLFSISLIAQPHHKRTERKHTGPKPIYIESHIVPSDSFSICYISYKVPFSNLVFVKNGNTFNSGLIFRIEATGEEGVLARESSHDKVALNSYEETNRTDKYLEGLISFRLEHSSATINPLIELENTQRQVPLRPFIVDVDAYEPMVVKQEVNCEDSHGYSIINFENSIPFDDKNHQLLIPIYNADENVIKVKIMQEGKDVYTNGISKVSKLSIGLEKCGKNIVIKNTPANKSANIFILNDFSNLLSEGAFELNILNEKDSVLYTNEMNVSWVDKPMSLMNSKFAYELLELMESEDNLDRIYDEADGKYEKAIDLFWEKYDPDKNTKYNQLMHEFYSRADKALREYSSRGERFGVITDRAKIYIKYGEPAEVDRYYSDKNEITEIWKYHSPKVEFVFVDATGLGNYKLVN